MIHLSIVIPVYNEQKRLKGLSKVVGFLAKQKFKSELIVVNDGSTDQTLRLLREFQEGCGLRNFCIVSYKTNRGKGYAIRRGMLKAKGRYQLFLDIDLSTPLGEFRKMVPFLGSFDIVIGSRKMKGASLQKKQPLVRETLGKCFTYLSQLVLGVWVSDFTCGFKCFSSKASTEIFRKARIDRWGFDSEILFIASKRRLSIKEIPVRWKNDANTKVKFPQDIFSSLRDLWQVRRNERRGRY